MADHYQLPDGSGNYVQPASDGSYILASDIAGATDGVHTGIEIILSSPPEPPRQARRMLPQGAFYGPVFSRNWLPVVLAAWTALATPESPAEIVQGRRFVPQQEAATEKTPYSRSWLAGIIAQWAQDADQPQARRLIAQEAVAQVDAPPIGYKPWLKTALASWEPAQIIVWQNGIQAVDGPAPDAHDQAIGRRLWLESVLRAWEPPGYAPQGWKRIVQQVVAQVDDPPFGLKPWLPTIEKAWAPASYDIQETRKVVQPGAAPAPDQPFGKRERLSWLIASWEQTLIPLWGGIGIQDADVPPPGLRRWLPGVIKSWEITWDAQTARHVVQQGPVFDNPPTTERQWLAALKQWAPDTWSAQSTRHIVQAGPVFDAPPVTERAWLRAVEAWEVPTWDAQTARHAPPPTPDTPPFGVRAWLPSVRGAWEPVPNAAQHRPPLVQPGPQVDEPPPTSRPWLALVNQTWEPAPYPPQGWKVLVQPTIVPPDDPPFGQRLWLSGVLLTWEPAEPQPRQAARQITEEGLVVPDPPQDTPGGGKGRWRRPRDDVDAEIVNKHWELLDLKRAAKREQAVEPDTLPEPAPTHTLPARRAKIKPVAAAVALEALTVDERLLLLERRIEELSKAIAENKALSDDDLLLLAALSMLDDD